MEMVTSWEREAIQVERRATITKILKLRFGDIDASLEGIIPRASASQSLLTRGIVR
jgi:hypothetical protein